MSFNFICEKCGDEVKDGKWKHHHYGYCIPVKKCTYCPITDTVEKIKIHEKTHHENYEDKLNNLSKRSANYKTFGNCKNCGKTLTVYASNVCQFCGDK